MGDWQRRAFATAAVTALTLGLAGYWAQGLERPSPVGPRAASPEGPIEGPVLVELFTSEGCSSCPPADRLLRELVDEGIVAGVPIVALEEHVSYWNHLGWRDPFSSSAFSRRQERYARALPSGVYTPQMVIDGREGLVGSAAADVRRAIAQAGHGPKLTVTLAPTWVGNDRVRVSWSVADGHARPVGADADVLLAITEDDLAVDVPRGENRGRRLEHVAVVRHLVTVGELDARDARLADAFEVRVSPEWNRAALNAAVFVQDRRTLQVRGAASSSIE